MKLTETQIRTLEIFFLKTEDNLMDIFNQNEEQGFDSMPDQVLDFSARILKEIEDFKLRVRRS